MLVAVRCSRKANVQQDGCGEEREDKGEAKVAEDVAFEHAEVAGSAALVNTQGHRGGVEWAVEQSPSSDRQVDSRWTC